MTTPDFSAQFDAAVDAGLMWLQDNGEFFFETMSLFKSIAWRLLAGIGVLWGAATLTFLAVNFAAWR